MSEVRRDPFLYPVMPPSPAHAIRRKSLLSGIDWTTVSRAVAKELTNREDHSPIVSAYRWWARRPHSVMGALLDAASCRYGQGMAIADPFSGGGTVTFEAAKRGIRAYAQDVFPWPARGLTAALQMCSQQELSAAAVELDATLQPMRREYQSANGLELSHVLRVRSFRCGTCHTQSFQFPHPMVSMASRSAGERFAYFGCSGCGAVSKRVSTVANFKCDACESRQSAVTPNTRRCECHSSKPPRLDWHPVLVQELRLEGKKLRAFLRPVLPGDAVASSPSTSDSAGVADRIPPGKETKRLLDNGFERWRDLYTDRQVRVLTRALEHVSKAKLSQAVRDRLAFCVLGAAEMPAFLSRWDRFNLKAFEGMANHRYTQTTLAVETNLLSPIGRGTLPRRLRTGAITLRWLIESVSAPPKVVSTHAGSRGRRPTDWDILVATGSSAKQALADRSVNVVLTDPPYFDDVQYGELSRLFHAWLRVYDPSLVFDEALEATPNTVRGTTAKDYEDTITACLSESRRTLKKDGALVLTFHNKKLTAWNALASALHRAGFVVTALAVVRAENEADHCKRNVEAMLHDLVLECRQRGRKTTARARLECHPTSLAEKNLAAIGLAVAECVRTGEIEQLNDSYANQLTRLAVKKRLID